MGNAETTKAQTRGFDARGASVDDDKDCEKTVTVTATATINDQQR